LCPVGIIGGQLEKLAEVVALMIQLEAGIPARDIAIHEHRTDFTVSKK
jgi:hypothetical protein